MKYARFDDGHLVEIVDDLIQTPGITWFEVPTEISEFGITSLKLEGDKVVANLDSVKNALTALLKTARKNAFDNLRIEFKKHSFLCNEQTRNVLASKALVASSSGGDKKSYSTNVKAEDGVVKMSHTDIVKLLAEIDTAVDELFDAEADAVKKVNATKTYEEAVEVFKSTKI